MMVEFVVSTVALARRQERRPESQSFAVAATAGIQ